MLRRELLQGQSTRAAGGLEQRLDLRGHEGRRVLHGRIVRRNGPAVERWTTIELRVGHREMGGEGDECE